MTMGLEPMRPEDWIEIDIFYDEEMALRRDVLETRKEIAVATHSAFPQAIEANWEVLELLVEFLPKRFPSRFAVAEGGTIIHNLSSGEVFDISDRSLDPLDVSSRLVQVRHLESFKSIFSFESPFPTYKQFYSDFESQKMGEKFSCTKIMVQNSLTRILKSFFLVYD